MREVGQLEVSRETKEGVYGGYRTEFTVQKFALVHTCDSCSGLTLSRYLWVDEVMDAPSDTDISVVFPEAPRLDGLPDGVSKRYLEMLELKNDPDSFAVKAGRTLEAVCADRGIPSRDEGSGRFQTLHPRLQRLADQGDIPGSLADHAELIKQFRNIGGHDSAFDLNQNDVPKVQRFVDVILDYLYRDPVELARITAEFEARKSQS